MISSVISVLGFLQDINDVEVRHQKELELFNSIKELLIEWLSLVDTKEKQEELCQQYCIHLSIIMMGRRKLNNHLIDYNDVALYLACNHIIQIKYRLTDIQIEKIISILFQMKSSLICNKRITFSENQGHNIVFVIPNEDFIDLPREQLSLQNKEKISIRIQEIQNNDWDNFIKTAIKEIG